MLVKPRKLLTGWQIRWAAKSAAPSSLLHRENEGVPGSEGLERLKLTTVLQATLQSVGFQLKS